MTQDLFSSASMGRWSPRTAKTSTGSRDLDKGPLEQSPDGLGVREGVLLGVGTNPRVLLGRELHELRHVELLGAAAFVHARSIAYAIPVDKDRGFAYG